MNIFKTFFLFFVLSFFKIVNAYEYEAIVVKVTDGDTINVQTKGEIFKIRLLYIDAPERNQDYGNSSRDFLKNIIMNKKVIIDTIKNDRYGRQLAEIYLYTSDKRIFINAKMIKSGNAWVYRSDRSNHYLMNLENHARTNKLGLWSNYSPVEPWKFRKKKY